MKTLTKIAAAVSAVSLAAGAQAGVITTSMSLSQLLNSPSGSFSGSFALNPLLSSNGFSGGHINSAVISAYGYSDVQTSQTQSYNEYVTSQSGQTVITGSYSRQCSSWNWSTCYYNTYGYALYRRVDALQQYVNRDDVVDTMLLSSGGGSAIDQVGYTSNVNEVYDGSYDRHNGTYGYDLVNHRTRYTDSFNSGELGASYALSAQDLLGLAQSGNLDFLVSALAGNFNLNLVSVTLDVTAVPVPEPESAALMLAGFAALAASARARRRSGKAS